MISIVNFRFFFILSSFFKVLINTLLVNFIVKSFWHFTVNVFYIIKIKGMTSAVQNMLKWL